MLFLLELCAYLGPAVQLILGPLEFLCLQTLTLDKSYSSFSISWTERKLTEVKIKYTLVFVLVPFWHFPPIPVLFSPCFTLLFGKEILLIFSCDYLLIH